MTDTRAAVRRALTGRCDHSVVPLLTVFLAIVLMPCFVGAAGFSAVFETDVDAGPGSEVAWMGYLSMGDFMSATSYDFFYSELNINPDWSMGGFACDGYRCHVLLETNVDTGGGNEVYLVSYESLTDFYTDTQAWWGYTAHNISPGWTTHGFASDGTRYYMVLESDADAGAGAEVYVMTYTSLANLIAGNEEWTGYTQMNVNPDFSIADLAADGEKFYLVLESNSDAGSGAEVYVITYASFDDLMTNTQESAGYSVGNVSAGWSIHGFAAKIPVFHDGFESGDTSAWSATVP